MHPGSIVLTFGVAFVVAFPAWADVPQPATAADREGDIVCGPRCLQYILRAMRPGDIPELVDLVKAVQPDFDRGSSLAALKQYLERRGLSTLAVRPSPATAIIWPHPVLLHLKGDAAGLGHYVVLMPGSDRSTATVWSGLVGTTRMPTWRLAEQVDGGALLIALRPIDSTRFAFLTTIDHDLRRLGWAAILVATPIIGFTWMTSHRRPCDAGMSPHGADG